MSDRIIPPEKFIPKMNMTPPRLIRDWGDEIDRLLRLYEFRTVQRGTVDEGEARELVAMKLHKDYLYGKWIMDELDEEAERRKLVEKGYLQNNE